MTLLGEFARLVVAWRTAFRQQRTLVRFLAVMVGLICTTGRRTVTGSIRYRGRDQAAWAADYKIFSRSKWDVGDLFRGVFAAAVRQLDTLGTKLPVVLSIDDTSVKKSSRVIGDARWMRDPLSPPFHVNLRYGLRYLHLALTLPFHLVGFAPRAVSVAFELAPSPKKPGVKATPEEWKQFRANQREFSLPNRALNQVKKCREYLNDLGMTSRKILVVGDGAYTNGVLLRGLPNGVDYIGRTGKKVALFLPAPAGGRKVYGERLPTPEQMRSDASIPYATAELFYGGKIREVRFKDIGEVLWKGGTRRKPMRLLIIAPARYRAPGGGRKWHYNKPAYLLTTDMTSPAAVLVQSYLDRWQIECVHRDLKTGLGLGLAQVYNEDSVRRFHSSYAAVWAMLTLAALRAFGPARTAEFAPLPAWRKVRSNHRASQEDIVERFRKDLEDWQTTTPRRSAPPSIPALPIGSQNPQITASG